MDWIKLQKSLCVQTAATSLARSLRFACPIILSKEMVACLLVTIRYAKRTNHMIYYEEKRRAVKREEKKKRHRSMDKQEDGGCRACAWIGACMARKRRMHACPLEPRDVRRPESLLPCLWLWGCVRDWLGWVALTCRHIEIVFSFFSFFLCVAWWVGAATAKAAQTHF